MVWLLGRYNRMHMGVGRKPNDTHRRREQLYVLCAHPSPDPKQAKVHSKSTSVPKAGVAQSTLDLYWVLLFKHGFFKHVFQKLDFLALDLKKEIIYFKAIVPRSEAPTKKVYVAVFPAGGMFFTSDVSF